MTKFVFPRWANRTPPVVGALLGGAPVYLTFLIWFGFSPKTIDVGYMPEQPVPYSHALHAGELGIDCRYCHTGVEKGPHAEVPPTETCMNCHQRVRTKSLKLEPIRAAFAGEKPVEWVKVHDLADFAYFNHSAHVTRGVGCVSCHGRVDKMVEVRQVEPLSMGWCLDCHRAPEKHLRPPEEVTNMSWVVPEGQDPIAYGRQLRESRNINPPEDCTSCHR